MRLVKEEEYSDDDIVRADNLMKELQRTLNGMHGREHRLAADTKIVAHHLCLKLVRQQKKLTELSKLYARLEQKCEGYEEAMAHFNSLKHINTFQG